MSGYEHSGIVDTPADFASTCGLDLNTLYDIAHKFSTEKADKAFHVTFDERILLSALSLQVKYGKCDRSKTPSLGFFDFVGKRRIAQWESLGDMDQDEAKREFVDRIDKLCPLFRSHLEAYLRNSRGKSPSSLTSCEEQATSDSSVELNSSASLATVSSDPLAFIAQNESAIRTALNEQTREKFMQYALQHYPSDLSKQTELISHLQERHFHEYVAYVKQQFDHRFNLSPQPPQNTSTVSPTAPCDRHHPGLAVAEVVDESADSTPQFPIYHTLLHNNVSQQITSSRTLTSSEIVADERTNEPPSSQPNPNTSLDSTTDQSSVTIQTSKLNGEAYSPHTVDSPIGPASMWTRAALHEFKKHLADAKDAIFQVGCGEVITIRVPVYPSGTSIVWEFATDDYDIGFGLFFEWSCDESNESTHELQTEHEHDASLRTIESSTVPSSQQVDEIIPVYRRNCHKEIYCGSHVYPGIGTYLLKFDNSYSLWRQKTLYCRVYYTCS